MTFFKYEISPLILTSLQINTTLIVNTGNKRLGWVIVKNESPYELYIQAPSKGQTYTILPQTADKIQQHLGDTLLQVVPKFLIPKASPSSEVHFTIYATDDENFIPPGDYPVSLSRQASPTDPAGQVGYSVCFVITNSASPTGASGINIFNPTNSGIIGRMFSIQAEHSGTGFVTANIAIRTDGTDNNFGLGTINFAHNVGGVGPKCHVTGFQNTTIAAPNTFEGTWILNQGQLYDFLGLPDNIYVNPGQNVLVDIQNPVASELNMFKFVWTEQ